MIRITTTHFTNEFRFQSWCRELLTYFFTLFQLYYLCLLCIENGKNLIILKDKATGKRLQIEKEEERKKKYETTNRKWYITTNKTYSTFQTNRYSRIQSHRTIFMNIFLIYLQIIILVSISFSSIHSRSLNCDYNIHIFFLSQHSVCRLAFCIFITIFDTFSNDIHIYVTHCWYSRYQLTKNPWKLKTVFTRIINKVCMCNVYTLTHWSFHVNIEILVNFIYRTHFVFL